MGLRLIDFTTTHTSNMGFTLQTGSCLHETDNSGYVHLTGAGALLFLKKSGCDSGTTEVHVTNDSFDGWELQTASALHETGDDWQFDVDKESGDVFCFKMSGTGSGSTEIHVLDAADGYSSFNLQTGTGLHECDRDSFALRVGPNRDVYCIKKNGTGSGSSEVHILSAESGYADFSLQTGSALHETDSSGDFLVDQGTGDVVFFKKSGCDSDSTEIHVLSAEEGYGAFSLQTATCLHETGDNFQFGLEDGAYVAFKKNDTGSSSTEVHRFELD